MHARARRAHQRQSEALRGTQRAHQRQSEALRGNRGTQRAYQRQSEALRGHIRGNQRQSEALREVLRSNPYVIRSNQEGPSVHASHQCVHHSGTHLGETLCEGFLFRLFGGQIGMAVELRPQCPPVPPPTVAECEPRLSHRVQDVAGSLVRLSLKGHLIIPGRRGCQFV